MDNRSYSEKLKDPRWQKRRLEVFTRDHFRCRTCGDEDSTLNCHHIFYAKGAEPWEAWSGHLITLCDCCHKGGKLPWNANMTIDADFFVCVKLFSVPFFKGLAIVMSAIYWRVNPGAFDDPAREFKYLAKILNLLKPDENPHYIAVVQKDGKGSVPYMERLQEAYGKAPKPVALTGVPEPK